MNRDQAARMKRQPAAMWLANASFTPSAWARPHTDSACSVP